MLPKGHLLNGARKLTIKTNFRKAKKKNSITYEELEALSGISAANLKKIANFGVVSDEHLERIEELFNTKLYN